MPNQKCRYCSAEIIFVRTLSGREMPCNSTLTEVWAHDKGKHTAIGNDGRTFKCSLTRVAFRESEYAYVVHWSECPGAGKARGKK